MSQGSWQEITRRWREDAPVALPTSPRRSGRPLKIFLVIAAILAVLGAFAGLLSWLQPSPNPYFVPLWITEYQARQIPFNPLADQDRDAFLAGGYFTRLTSQTLTRQEGHLITQELVNLSSLKSGDSVVVYLSAHALLGDKGKVHILPGDASPDNPMTWLTLKEILERLRDCPARHKLLVLDIMKPLRGPRLGVLQHDIAAAIPEELRAVPDPERLVLCSCAPGQESLVSEELGRSVFGFYLEEGLRGYAEAFRSIRTPDDQISVRELAAFVQARVDRWATINRGQRQTPTLHGTGADFPLIALDYGVPQARLKTPEKLTYPDWLSKGWTQRDQHWRGGGYRLDPRAFQKVQAVLHDAERDWRGGLSTARIKDNLLSVFERQQAILAGSRALVQPASLSLAQEKAQGAAVDENLVKAVRELFVQLPRQSVGLKPDEGAKLRTKLVDEFRAKNKDASEFALHDAVFAWMLVDTKRSPETLQLAEDLLHRADQLRPPYIEILFLRQLAALSSSWSREAWPAEAIAQALEVVYRGEEAAAHHAVYPWMKEALQEAALARHEGELRLFAPGYASLSDAQQLLKKADQRYQVILSQAGKIQRARTILDQALALLPECLSLFDHPPAQGKVFEEAVQVAQELAELLLIKPGKKLELAEVEKAADHLGTLIDDLQAPFVPANVSRLIKQSQFSQAKGSVVRTLDAALGTPAPWLSALDRVALWQARHDLARRLLDETRTRDLADDGDTDLEPYDAEARQREINQAAWEKGRAYLALFRLAGLQGERLQPLQEVLERITPATSQPAVWGQAAALVRQVWAVHMPGLFQEATDPARRALLTWLLAPLDSLAAIDETPVTPTTILRRGVAKEQWSWLGDHYRYLARDYQDLGLDNPAVSEARKFYAHAATANQEYARLAPEAFVVLQLTAPPMRLTRSNPSTTATLQIQQFLPQGPAGPIAIQLFAPDSAWLNLNPEKLTLTPPIQALASVVDSLPIQISLKTSTGQPASPPPAGILAQAKLLGRPYHYAIPVPLQGAAQDVEIFLSTNPKEPEPLGDELRLRPNKHPTPLYVFVKNLSAKPRKVLVEINTAGRALKAGPGPLILQAGELRRLTLTPEGSPAGKTLEPPPKDAGKPPAGAVFHGPLEVRLLDADLNVVLDQRKLRVTIASPREYVQVTDILYQPANAKNPDAKLSVKVQTLSSVPGPPIPVELILPAKRIPGLRDVGGGTFQGELPNLDKTPPITLFAEKLLLAPGADEEGPVYLNVDGVERAFLFRVSFVRRGDPSTPRGDARPALRVLAPPFTPADPAFTFPVEVDNAPVGAKLEVSLGRLDADAFQPEAVQIFDDPRQSTILLHGQAPDGALLFEASIRDWQVVLNASRILGSRYLRARLIDETGLEILQTTQKIVIDGSIPVVRFVDPPAKAKRGSTIDIQALAADSESGIAQAVFFLGKPQEGKIPPNTPTFAATMIDPTLNLWSARVLLPDDRKGPTPISVQFTNKVGLASFATAMLDLTDAEPAKGPGRITGKVTEGPRPQPDLVVTLFDEKGKPIAKAKTQPDGAFAFDNVAPGKYRVYCFKPDSMRRANVAAVVEAGKTTPANLALAF